MDNLARISSPVPAPQIWPNRGYAWYVVLMLMLAYGFSIVDRIGLGLLVQPIEADLHISDAQMGLLQGFAFALFYSVLGLPIGFLADRVNRRSLITLGITLWSAATIFCGLANGFGGLFAARIGVGAGEATLNPAGTSMIADYFPPEARPKAYGVYAAGTSIGSAMAFLLSGAAITLASHLRAIGPDWMAALAPWKIVFFMIGAPGILVGIIFACTVREPVRLERAGIKEKGSLRPLLSMLYARKRIYFGIIAAMVLNSVSVYALVGWFPTLLIRMHGWTPAETGRIMGTYGVPCGAISCLSAGWMVAWLQKRGQLDAPLFAALGATAWVTASGVAASLVASPNLAMFFYCMLGLATNFPIVAMLTALNRVTPNEMRGQVMALNMALTGLIALTVGPFAVGYLSDHVFGQPLGIGKSLATVLGISGTLGVCVIASARSSFRLLVGEVVQR